MMICKNRPAFTNLEACCNGAVLDQSEIVSRIIIRIWVYAYPLPAVAAMWFAWSAWSQSGLFSAYVNLLPIFYGYVMPGIATNILRKWKFKGAWVVGSFYVHHGFIYAAHLSPALFISLLGTPCEPLSLGTSVRVCICTASLYGFVAWFHDILMVRHGMVEIQNQLTADHRSAEEIVTLYAPLCFFLIGLIYAAAALLGFHVFVSQHRTGPAAITWVSLAGFSLLLSVPSLAYRALEGKKPPSNPPQRHDV